MFFASQVTNFDIIWGIQDLTFISEDKKKPLYYFGR